MAKLNDQVVNKIDVDVIRGVLLCVDENQSNDPELIMSINALISVMEQNQRDKDGEKSNQEWNH